MITVVAGLMLLLVPVQAGELIPPKSFKAYDTPNDGGGSISLVWRASPSDSPEGDYVLHMAHSPEGPWQEAERGKANTYYKNSALERFGFRRKNNDSHLLQIDPRRHFSSDKNRKALYYFKLAMARGEEFIPVEKVVSGRARGNWVNNPPIKK